MFVIVLVLAYLVTSSGGFPLFGNFLLSKDDVETTTPVVIHHRHKHHYRHKHRRSLASKEEAKLRRNKHLLLTKPYWPWP
ncbi:hypothetical protein OESDEN_08589 [Oesophagostomum dentatum]|uniref:Secreted protein n=1 Tax=Oesophagostomum dentatum TaxID=61180 RepID=A0A0B1T1X5_OESDE|nr:hypothetical protein OESDEN_08589 [Oesophagostomum dentatum]